MTAAQMKKLETIVGKIEALQRDIGPKASQEDRDALAAAKRRLMERLA